MVSDTGQLDGAFTQEHQLRAVLRGLRPLIGVLFMAVMFFTTIPGLNGTNLAVGLGAMALGLIPMTHYGVKPNPYFDLPTKEDRVAVLEEFEMNL